MAVQFILRTDPNSNRKVLIDKMYEQLKKDSKMQMLYLVPDNVKYEAETMILQQFKDKDERSKYSGMIRLQVFSFSRLAWYRSEERRVGKEGRYGERGV